MTRSVPTRRREQIRTKAARDWTAWEDAVISLEPNGDPTAYSAHPSPALLAFVRICTHYFSHAAWLDEGILLRQAHRLTGIPAVLLHGRLDLGSPLDTPWHLARSWPDARLIIVNDAGHTGSPTWTTEIITALNTFVA